MDPSVQNTVLPPELEVEFDQLGGTVMIGGVVSAVRVTVKLEVPTFPAASDAVQVTVVVPAEKLEPEGGEQVIPEVTPTLSVALAIKVIISGGKALEFIMLDGTVTTGGVVSAGGASSVTVTVKLAVPTFPAASDAVQVTVVVPAEKLEPEGGEQVVPEVTPTLSVALAIKVIISGG